MKRVNDQAGLLHHLKSRISESHEALAAHNIRAELVMPSPDREQVPEIAVYFWRDTQVLDVIEFALSQSSAGGSDADLASWFDEQWNEAVSTLTKSG